tara:strand:+ start:235 stop:1095 length:861 start_codon:yes stop_codon:yes gene_type:complete
VIRTIFIISLVVEIGFSYTVGLVERNLGTSPNWKIARAKTFQMDIGHRFVTTLENDGDWSPAYQELLGMDGAGNIGLAFTYGIANFADVTLTRYRLGKQYKISNKLKLLDQYVDRQPISLTTDINYGYRTLEDIDVANTYGYTLILGRYLFNERLSFNLITAGQNSISSQLEEYPYAAKWTHAVGGSMTVRHNRWTFSGEYMRPVTGYVRENSEQVISDTYGVSVAYRTYQHLFSIGVQNHIYNNFNEMIAGANNTVSSLTDLRFGFNIIREFDFLLEDSESKRDP